MQTPHFLVQKGSISKRQCSELPLIWIYFPSSCSLSCIRAVSGSCRRLNGVCLFQALGVDSLLLMQWERSRGAAGRAKTAAASHRVTDWTNSILCSNNTASVALGAGACSTLALVMLFCVRYHISNLKNFSVLFSCSMPAELLLLSGSGSVSLVKLFRHVGFALFVAAYCSNDGWKIGWRL